MMSCMPFQACVHAQVTIISRDETPACLGQAALRDAESGPVVLLPTHGPDAVNQLRTSAHQVPSTSCSCGGDYCPYGGESTVVPADYAMGTVINFCFCGQKCALLGFRSIVVSTYLVWLKTLPVSCTTVLRSWQSLERTGRCSRILQ